MAEEAATASRQEAQRLREQTQLMRRQAERQSQRAQRIFMRALQARSGGFFTGDAGGVTPSQTLG